MSRAPSVIHFRCLDTMGLRDVARVIGSGQAGVRLTGRGLALYRRGTRRGPPPLPPSGLVAESFTEAALEAQREAPRLEPVDARETLAPCVASISEEPSDLPADASEPETSLVEVTLRRPPTVWAVAFLTVGITFGAAVARIVTNAPRVSVAAASVAAPPAQVAWPGAMRVEPAAVVTIAVTESSRARRGPEADPPADPLSTSPRTRSAHRHATRPAAPTADAPPSPEHAAARAVPASTTTDAEDAQATVAQARDALTDAL